MTELAESDSMLFSHSLLSKTSLLSALHQHISLRALSQMRFRALLYSIQAAPFCTRTLSTISKRKGTVLPRPERDNDRSHSTLMYRCRLIWSISIDVHAHNYCPFSI